MDFSDFVQALSPNTASTTTIQLTEKENAAPATQAAYDAANPYRLPPSPTPIPIPHTADQLRRIADELRLQAHELEAAAARIEAEN